MSNEAGTSRILFFYQGQSRPSSLYIKLATRLKGLGIQMVPLELQEILPLASKRTVDLVVPSFSVGDIHTVDKLEKALGRHRWANSRLNLYELTSFGQRFERRTAWREAKRLHFPTPIDLEELCQQLAKEMEVPVGLDATLWPGGRRGQTPQGPEGEHE